MPTVVTNFTEGLGTMVPNIVAAIVILVIGWIVAALLAALTRGVLRRTGLDARLRRALGGTATAPEVSGGVATAVFYLVLLFVVVAALQALNLTVVTAPLNALLTVVLSYLPRVGGALLLLLLAWLLATVLRTVIVRVSDALHLDERLSGAPGMDERPAPGAPARSEPPAAGASASSGPTVGAGAGVGPAATPAAAPARPVARALGEIVYWLVFLLFLPGILSALGIEGMLAPLLVMLNRLLGFLPNLLAAGVILAVGWFVARLVQRIVAGLLAALGVDALADRLGIGRALGNQRLSGLLGAIVYVLLLIPVLLAALNALNLDALTLPVSNMLNTLLAALPNLFAAALLLAIAYVGGRLIGGLVANLLAATFAANALVHLAGHLDLDLLAPRELVDSAAGRLANAVARGGDLAPLLLAVPAYAAVGVLWGAVYGDRVEARLRRRGLPDWGAGLAFAALPLAAALLVLLPALGLGFPGSGASPVVAAGEAVRHAVYGLVLGLSYPVLLARPRHAPHPDALPPPRLRGLPLPP